MKRPTGNPWYEGKNTYILNFIFATLLSTVVLAAESQVFTLKDGSQIKGELSGIANGVYTIRTTAMGDIKVAVSQVATISNGSILPPQGKNSFQQPADANFDQKIQSAQSKLMSDPQLMTNLQEMMQDPELMKMLSDPELVQAVTSRDVKAIEANPKAQSLINNPKIRKLMDEMQGKGYYN